MPLKGHEELFSMDMQTINLENAWKIPLLSCHPRLFGDLWESSIFKNLFPESSCIGADRVHTEDYTGNSDNDKTQIIGLYEVRGGSKCELQSPNPETHRVVSIYNNSFQIPSLTVKISLCWGGKMREKKEHGVGGPRNG